MEKARNLTGKERMKMNNLHRKIKNMKYRSKLTLILMFVSLVPMLMISMYSYVRMSRLVRTNEVERMNSILDQTRNTIDSQIQVYTSLINYLTYSPELEGLIKNTEMDEYEAYELYTQVADPLLSVPKSYHDAILQIQLYTDNIQVQHDYTLIPFYGAEEKWWYELLTDEVGVQWMVNPQQKEIAAVRRICQDQASDAMLCVVLDYDKVFEPFLNITTEEAGGMITDPQGNILFCSQNSAFAGEASQKAETLLEDISKECVCVNRVSQGCDWVYYLYRPQSDITRSVQAVLISEIPLIILALVLILVLGPFLSRRLTRGIEQLTENMNRVNQGSREVTVYSESEDEIGVLIRSFRNMMNEIDRLIKEVYENKIALKEYELKALQAQINPHFLYNSLSVINWMAIRSNQKEISKITLALSTFYRTALSKGEDMVTVENSVKNIEAYLEIQLVMHDHDFRVIWDKDAEIMNEKIPKLILQPVVENALEHGLDLKEEGEKILEISFKNDGADVLIVVEDNGLGMEQEKAESMVTYQTKGYGLKNVNDRICLLYGETYSIGIFSEVGRGTRIEIRIPKGGKVIM